MHTDSNSIEMIDSHTLGKSRLIMFLCDGQIMVVISTLNQKENSVYSDVTMNSDENRSQEVAVL